jgi:hypothetical protein
MTEEDFKDDPRGLSDWLKDKGNTHYKGKQFEEVGFRPCSIKTCARKFHFHFQVQKIVVERA